MNFGNVILRCASLALLGMGACAMGCVAAPEEMDADYEEEIEEREVIAFGGTGDPETQNHLRYQVVMNHGVQHTVRNLGSAAIVNANNQLPQMNYMPSPLATGELQGARVEFLEVLIGCALPAGVTVTDPGHTLYWLGGTPVKKGYSGDIGLAPHWLTRGLYADEKKWITACVLARTNRYGATVDIWLNGTHTQIDTLSRLYPAAESKAWGNMFDSPTVLSTTDPGVNPGVAPFEGFMCSYATWCADPQDALFRSCDDENTPCGFSYMQDCSAFETFCNSPTGWGFQGCVGRFYGIKTYLKSDDTGCSPFRL